MNNIGFKLRLYHPNASATILDKWFRIFYVDLVGDDDVYNIKYSYEHLKNEKTKACVLFINIEFNSPMNFDDFIEFIDCFIEFKNAEIYTLYNTPVQIELTDDKVIYNKEEFYLQDLSIINSKMKERLSELKHKWGQV